MLSDESIDKLFRILSDLSSLFSSDRSGVELITHTFHGLRSSLVRYLSRTSQRYSLDGRWFRRCAFPTGHASFSAQSRLGLVSQDCGIRTTHPLHL